MLFSFIFSLGILNLVRKKKKKRKRNTWLNKKKTVLLSNLPGASFRFQISFSLFLPCENHHPDLFLWMNSFQHFFFTIPMKTRWKQGELASCLRKSRFCFRMTDSSFKTGGRVSSSRSVDYRCCLSDPDQITKQAPRVAALPKEHPVSMVTISKFELQ